MINVVSNIFGCSPVQPPEEQVGFARGTEASDQRAVANLFVSRVATIQTGTILAIVFFPLLRVVLP